MMLLVYPAAMIEWFANGFVRGVEGNLFDEHPYKYAWIDTNWRPL